MRGERNVVIDWVGVLIWPVSVVRGELGAAEEQQSTAGELPDPRLPQHGMEDGGGDGIQSLSSPNEPPFPPGVDHTGQGYAPAHGSTASSIAHCTHAMLSPPAAWPSKAPCRTRESCGADLESKQFTADFANMRYLCSQLESALQEGRSQHSRRVLRQVK